MRPNRLAVTATLVAAALFGTSATSRALADVELSAMAVAAGRLFVGALGLVLIVVIRSGWSPLFRMWRLPWIWFMGLAVAGYQGLFFVGTGLTGVAVGTVASLALGPLFAGALGWAINRERPSKSWWLATALAVIGVLSLSFDALQLNSVLDPLGVLAAIGAGASYAVYTVLGSKGIKNNEDSTTVLAAAFLLGAVFLTPALAGAGSSLFTPTALWLMLWLGLVATTLAYVLFGLGLRTLSASSVATLNLAEPVVATLLGVFILQESLSLTSSFGILLIAVALSLLAISSMKVSSS